MQSTLTIHLSALKSNYNTLKSNFTGRETAAVVKANAYGLGVKEVARALMDAGCTRFFVATLEEGLELRSYYPDLAIHVFHGPFEGEERTFLEQKLIPCINHLSQLEHWLKLDAPYVLHVDTGMTRLGLTEFDMLWLEKQEQQKIQKNLVLIMSHLACASEPGHSKNQEQLERFNRIRAKFPNTPASLCNSAGIYLGKEFHFDMARPGVSLYGVNPTPEAAVNPMQQVVTWSAPIIQLRHLDHDETIGYGATCIYPRGSRVAICQLGYADGYMRLLSNKGVVFIGNAAAPVIGRVSMDMIAIDVGGIPEDRLDIGHQVEVLGRHQTVDDLASACNTIGYEILTHIGARVKRQYR